MLKMTPLGKYFTFFLINLGVLIKTIYFSRDYIKIAPKKYKNHPKNYKNPPKNSKMPQRFFPLKNPKKNNMPLKIQNHNTKTKIHVLGGFLYFLEGKTVRTFLNF